MLFCGNNKLIFITASNRQNSANMWTFTCYILKYGKYYSVIFILDNRALTQYCNLSIKYNYNSYFRDSFILFLRALKPDKSVLFFSWNFLLPEGQKTLEKKNLFLYK